MSSDPAVSEILSFILILGITALGITVFTAAVLPEMEKSEEISHENQLTESVLEDEGMRVFEWWGGEYRPLEELIAEMDEVKQNNKSTNNNL